MHKKGSIVWAKIGLFYLYFIYIFQINKLCVITFLIIIMLCVITFLVTQYVNNCIILTVTKIRPNTVNDTVLKNIVTNAKGRTVTATSSAYLRSSLKYFILYV